MDVLNSEDRAIIVSADAVSGEIISAEQINQKFNALDEKINKSVGKHYPLNLIDTRYKADSGDVYSSENLTSNLSTGLYQELPDNSHRLTVNIHVGVTDRLRVVFGFKLDGISPLQDQGLSCHIWSNHSLKSTKCYIDTFGYVNVQNEVISSSIYIISGSFLLAEKPAFAD